MVSRDGRGGQGGGGRGRGGTVSGRGRGATGTGRGGRGGRGRGRGRGTGRPAGPRNHGHKLKDWTEGEQFGAYKPKVAEIASEEEEEDLQEEVQDNEIDLASAAPLAYNALLTLMRPDAPAEPRKKKRKVQQEVANQEAVVTDEDIKDDDPEEPAMAHDVELVEGEETSAQDDPFETHFDHPMAELLQSQCDAAKAGEWSHSATAVSDGKIIIDALPESNVPNVDPMNRATWYLKQRIASSVASKSFESDVSQPLQQHMIRALYTYRDISYSAANYKHTAKLQSLYCLHVLNHIFKTRDRILKNNAKSSAHPELDAEYRDQGFTRPKVLILLPTRNACLNVANELISISGAEQIENRKRFNDEFGTDGVDPLKNANKPDDFKATFAGNTDDAFRIGIKFTRKTIKLFSKFYSSDIILASPLGLKMAINAGGDKKSNWDYLSSIELVVLDAADAMAMQNWEHVETCFAHLNQLPKESHDCDYGRVRNWALEERSSYLRQTILISSYEFPELRALFNSFVNVAGKVRIKPKYDGAILDTGIVIRQTFQRFESDVPSSDPESRFQFFKGSMLPRLRKLAQGSGDTNSGCLLFVPSYFDFVRVRNYLTSLEISFEAASEYSSTSDLTRSRHLFASGRSPILLMTERLHHYRRYDIKGVKNVIFYQLPEHSQFFIELVRCAAAPGQAKADGEIRVGYSKWDESRLERVVGSKRIGKMLSGKDTTFEFM